MFKLFFQLIVFVVKSGRSCTQSKMQLKGPEMIRNMDVSKAGWKTMEAERTIIGVCDRQLPDNSTFRPDVDIAGRR